MNIHYYAVFGDTLFPKADSTLKKNQHIYIIYIKKKYSVYHDSRRLHWIKKSAKHGNDHKLVA